MKFFALILFMFISGTGIANNSGWNILHEDFDSDNTLDFSTIEWEYFMIHDHYGRFNGMVGYVLTNPRSNGGPVKQLMPVGGNLAVGGRFNGQPAVGEYVNFGLEGLEVNSLNLQTVFSKGDHYSSIENVGNDSLRLAGDSEKFTWDFIVSQDFKELTEGVNPGEAFSATTETKIGRLKNEVWTVDALWPKTSVQGFIVNKESGELVQVDGKGYRENSWGRYLMPLDGWDFLVFSEDQDDGVVFVLQTYHKSEGLDFLDLGFFDDGVLKKVRFDTKHLRWKHRNWTWSKETHQCVPLDWYLEGEADGYKFEADVQMPIDAQKPFLSSKQLGTAIFFIQEQYPTVKGTIHRSSGEFVTEFNGQAGGEFAVHKGIIPVADWTCRLWGKKFSN